MKARRGLALAALLVLALLMPPAVNAAVEQVVPGFARERGWSLGALLLVVDRPYRGKPTRILAVPAVGYQGRYVFLQGIRLGFHVERTRRFTFNIIAQPRLSSFKASDIPQIPGLEDRSDSLDAGFSARVGLGTAGALGLMAVTDVLDRSNGQEIDLRYQHRLRLGPVSVAPWAGVRWLSAHFTDYYYGTLPAEVARGAPDYRPGAAYLPQVGLSVFAPIGRSGWSAYAFFNTAFLPGRLRDSPLVSGGTSSTLVAGVSYRF